MLKSILLVGLGGFVGSVARYLISRFVAMHSTSPFPTGTFAINILGSFLIGIIIAAFLGEQLNHNAKLFLATGLCGGFTTFSSFSYEFFSLLQNQQAGYAFLYAGASFGMGLLFVWLGFNLVKP